MSRLAAPGIPTKNLAVESEPFFFLLPLPFLPTFVVHITSLTLLDFCLRCLKGLLVFFLCLFFFSLFSLAHKAFGFFYILKKILGIFFLSSNSLHRPSISARAVRCGAWRGWEGGREGGRERGVELVAA